MIFHTTFISRNQINIKQFAELIPNITKSYTGDGATLTFALTTYSNPNIKHTANSVIVCLNGVNQIGGTNYTVEQAAKELGN